MRARRAAVPAPATELILRGIPTYSGEIKSELCTPTGAALLRYFVDEFGEAPVMTVSMAGYGTGKKDFEVLNAVRVLLGETERQHDEVLELSCNIDDMTGKSSALRWSGCSRPGRSTCGSRRSA